ncbi:MAG: hypothetical protein AAB275_05310 [Deltaproteobacteria bacterium]
MACKEGNDREVRAILKKLVPEYNYFTAKDSISRPETVATLEAFESATMH